MTRDDFPTRPEGMSAVTNQLTVLWMEIGDRAVYQIGRRANGVTPIYLRVTQTIMHVPDYIKGLALETAFVCEIRGGRQTTPTHLLPPSRTDKDVDDLLSGRPSRTSVPPPARAVPGRLERIPLDFVSIDTLLGYSNRKRLRVRQDVRLPLFPENAWCLMLGFSNLSSQPRIVRAASSDIIPSGF